MALLNDERFDKAIEWFANFIRAKQHNNTIDFYSGFMEKMKVISGRYLKPLTPHCSWIHGLRL